MPEISRIGVNSDSIAVEVHKDGAGVAHGQIYAYATLEEAKAHPSPQAHYVGDWSSPASNDVVGTGSIGLECHGKYLMVDQRAGATRKWCTVPCRAGIGIAG